MTTIRIAFAAGLVAALGSAGVAPAGDETVRPAAKAGTWYPADAAVLRAKLKTYLDAAGKPELPGEPVAIICPHAGYAFSGPTAALAFKAVAGRKIKRVILIGPSHHMAGQYTGAAVPTVTHFATPLGKIPLDTAACRKLAQSKHIVADDKPHGPEHCLEMALPLMQATLPGARIVPVLMGATNFAMVQAIAKELRPLVDKHTLVVASTDFTHYGPNYRYVPFKTEVPQRLKYLDGLGIDRILAVDPRGFTEYCADYRATICGQKAVAVTLAIFANQADTEGVLLGYTTSGAITKDYTNSVSYAAIALCRGAAAPLDAAEQKLLLRMARDQLRQHLATGKPMADVEKKYALTPKLKKPAPAFVTLKTGGDLRGCIGHVTPIMPLYQSVLANAVSACSRDPRFVGRRITAAELPKVHIEISVLSRHRRIDDAGDIKIGRDGLILERGRNRGLLLPQVPVEQKWSRDRYLAGISRKAGLAADGWKDPKARLSAFTAQVFGEPHATTRPASGKPD